MWMLEVMPIWVWLLLIAMGFLIWWKSREEKEAGGESDLGKNVRWLAVDDPDNSFDFEILDCRTVAENMRAATSDRAIAESYARLRNSTGEEFRDKRPAGGRLVTCDLTYFIPKAYGEGPLFKAGTMDEKWDVHFYNSFLIFSRSWTGDVISRARTNFEDGMLRVVEVETCYDGDDHLALHEVDFLIKSHLFGLSLPHPMPRDFGRDPQQLAMYSFSRYGSKGLFGFLA